MKINHAFKIGSSLLKARITNRNTPIKVTYFVTYRCNLNCTFCKRKGTVLKELSLEKAKQIMEWFRNMGTIIWVFNGGEPLLKDGIEKLIEYSKELDFYTCLITNGTLIKSKIKAIKNIDYINVSIDGDRLINDRIRGAGTYEKTLEGLKILSDHKIKTTIMTVINKDNVSNLNHTIQLAEKYKCGVQFQPIAIHPEDKLEDTRNFFPSGKDFSRAIDWLIEQKEKGSPIVSSKIYLEKIKKSWPYSQNKIRCYAGKLHCCITPDGKITPCCGKLSIVEVEPNFRLNNSLKCGLKTLPDMSKCQDCFYSGPLELNLSFNLLSPAMFERIKNTFFKHIHNHLI